MNLFQIESWPLWVLIAVLLGAQVLNDRTLLLRNWLTFPLVLSGWLLGLLHSFDLHPDAGAGGLGAALASSALAFFLLFPVLVIHGIGAGSVKLQMGIGAWCGAFFGLKDGLIGVAIATIVAAVVLGLVSLRTFTQKEGERPQLIATAFPQCVGVAVALAVLLLWL